MLCYVSSNFCAFSTNSFIVSDSKLKMHRSALSTKISVTSNNTVLDTGTTSYVVRFLLCRHLAKKIDAIIHVAGATLLP